MKKLFAVLLILVLTCSLLPGVALAAPSDYALTGGSVTLDGTTDRLIDVKFISISGGSYYSFSGDWSKTETEGSSYLTLTALTSEKASAAMENDVGSGRTVWMDMTYSAPITVAAGGAIWTATYTVDKNTPSGTYTVTLNVDGCTAGDYNADPAGLLTATIIVTRSDSPVTEGYTVTVTADKTEVKVDETVKISFDVTSSSAYAFNAFYGTLYYDDAAFSYSLASSSASGYVVDDSAYGKLEISRVGSDVSIHGSGPELSLTFTAETVAESATFILRNAKVDMADKANGDAAAAGVSGMPSVKVSDKESEGEKLHVTMRLIGAELAEKDVDLGAAKYMPNYVTWIPTTEYELDEEATVYDLWVKATGDAGIRSVGADKNYVSTVYAPDSLGGYALSEFTNGRRSGWMYTINGRHPGYGLKEQELRDGDVVIWHYVNDYSYEVADWFGEGQWQALGDGTYYNRWLKAPDYFGGKGGGLSEDSSSEEDEDETGTGVVIYVAVDEESGNTVTVPDERFTEAVETALDTGEKQITIVVTKAEEGADIIVELSPRSARMAAQNGIGLRVELPLGTVWIDPSDVKDVFGDVRNTVSFEIYKSVDHSVVVNLREGRDPISADDAFHSRILASAFGRTTTSAGDVVYLVNADGSETLVRKSLVESKYVYTLLDGSAILRLRYNAKKFVDVEPDNWFAEAVDFTSGHELFIGISDTEFGPKLTMTRAMLVTVLYRLEDKPNVAGKLMFTDVEAGTWYTEAVEWAAKNGIVNGVGENLYAPNADVTREQIATMLYRYAQYLGRDVSGRASLDKFHDGDQVSDWAKEAVQWAVKLGIFRGDDTGALNPKSNATRAEVATLMQRIVTMIVK